MKREYDSHAWMGRKDWWVIPALLGCLVFIMACVPVLFVWENLRGNLSKRGGFEKFLEKLPK